MRRRGGRQSRRERLGRRGEAVARRLLRREGARIIARRWRCARGEIDLLAREGDVLVVVEVRTQTGRSWGGGPAYSIGPAKRRKLAQLATIWLRRASWRPSAVRFDVVTVERQGWLRWRARRYRGAFDV